MSTQMTPITCPSCGQTDAVQTAAAAGIAAPVKPSDFPLKMFRVWQWGLGAGFAVILLLVLLCLLGSVVVSGFNAALAGLMAATSDPSMAAVGAGVGLLPTIPLLCINVIILLFAGGGLVGLPYLIGRWIRKTYEPPVSLWQRAVDKYDRLYHCRRCAGVFLEGQNRLVPLEQMHSFLYEMQVPPLSPYGG